MVKTNIQTFTGEVEILSNLHLGDGSYYMTANADASNVIQVTGNVGATFFVGDGGFLSNIATTLSDIVDQGNTVSNVVQFSSDAGVADYKGVGLVTDSNVGIQNTSPDHTLAIGDKVRFDTNTNEALGQSVIEVDGRILATRFEGDGGLLSNIATTLESIVNQGNVSANVVKFSSNALIPDYTGVGLVTDSNVGIQNTNPVFNLSVGSNLHVDDEGSNVLVVHGNVAVSNLNLGAFTVSPSHDLDQVCAEGNTVTRPVRFSNVITGISAASNIESAGTFISTDAERGIDVASNIDIGGRLKFDSNVFIDTLRVADIAANIVTYDSSTGELLDSSGTFMNKFAVVSEQPPSDFFANTTTVTNHGSYTLTTSNLATNSNTFNAFDGTANAWVSGGLEGGYIGGSNVFHEDNLTQLSNLHPTQFGDWLAIEFPYKTTLRHMKLTPLTAAQFPASANLYATNNDLTWTEVKYWNDVVPASDTAVQTITVDATEQFKKYALVATKAAGNSSNVAIQDWQLFTESFSIDGGKVAMAQQAATGGETVMDQSGPHGRGAAVLKKYPEIAFDASKLDGNDSTNTYVQAGYTVTASSQFSGYHPWEAFDEITGNGTQYWSGSTVKYATTGDYGFLSGNAVAPYLTTVSDTVYNGEWIQLELPHKLKLSYVTFFPRLTNRFPRQGVFAGSNDGTNWDAIHIFSELTTTIETDVRITTDSENNTTAYKYIRLVITHLNGNDYAGADNIKLYGYEEDPPAGDTSIDTTFTSIMNTPQTTGANVYVDGSLGETFTNRVTGPTVSNTHTTYVSAEKYWELSGNVESNVTIEANTFLSGDAPHSVSMWFNSSNLEANVSNTCVFSISDQEHLNSENLDLQSNTWHNLTYAYQGEGGSRVTYLDGRKVAEDQAEDTFGAYPPFAMTGPSQGGYVVSASAESNDGSYNSYEAFNGVINDNTALDAWQPNYNSGGDFDTNGNATTQTQFNPGGGASLVNGPALLIQFPHRVKITSYDVYARRSNDVTYAYANKPKSGRIYGSNDGLTWTQIDSFGDWTTWVANKPQTEVITTPGAYNRYAMVVESMIYQSQTWVAIGEWKLYGHRENDLVRLPEPTRVLKYPHIAMTGPAQRGYVASASAEDSASSRYAWKAFNNILPADLSTDFWFSASSRGAYTGGTSGREYVGSSNLGTDSGRTATVGGEWIQVQLPNKIRLTTFNIYGQPNTINNFPASGVLYARNETTEDWTSIYEYNDVTISTIGAKATHTPTTSTFYNTYALSITKKSNSIGGVSVGELQLYGTGVDSIPIQIGGGNIDKVANFRVYDKFVGEDQALEIWDAQKDEFGRAKSSMTLHKGRLGIGTTEPEGRLAVLDEPSGLEEFPPRAMTGYKTYMEGHGEFCVYSSSVWGGSYHGWKAFTKGVMNPSYTSWISESGSYSTTTGLNVLSRSFQGNLGEYLTIELPYKIQLKRFTIQRRYTQNETFETAVFYGSEDGITWSKLKDIIMPPYDTGYNEYPFIINDLTHYKHFGIVVTKIRVGQVAYCNIGELRLFGTREQGQSVLHDGQLTLTKNLDVPRIGPPLDADVTPRRDRLVVEYNTLTNHTFEGAVRDTSGRGLDGVFTTGAGYNAIKKELTFNGATTSGVSIGGATGVGGDRPFSVSLWFNASALTGSVDNALVGWGAQTSQQSFLMTINTTNNKVLGQFYGNGMSVSPSGGINLGTWYHAVLTYPGGGHYNMSIYVDGVKGANTNAGTNLGGLIPEDSEITIGTYKNTSNQGFNGLISNFKLYDCVLTAQEVKTLYDMGRCDEGHHVVNFSKTRVGIGLGDGEAPTYTLDVRGQIRSQGSLVTSFTGQHKCVPEEPVEKGLIVSAKKNQYVKLNGSLDTGKSAITIDESLPIVSLSNVVQDKACFGVVSSTEEANTTFRVETTNGGVISYIPKTLGDNRAIVNSVGEGAIWVVNTGGSLESGDYITTSNVAGYGQKQEDDVLHNYTVAKITMDCDFTGSNVAVQTIKREETGLRTITEDVWNDLIDYDRSSNTETQYSNTLVPSAYSGQSGYTPREVTTIVDYTDGSNLISIAEWSNLESNIQNTYQSNTFTEIADYTKFISLDEWSNLTVDVQNTYSEAEITTYYQIKRGENVLDENGQLQFEDKTGATEAPYERRFLDASGAQTDEANAVHIAAFVGCTYHCG